MDIITLCEEVKSASSVIRNASSQHKNDLLLKIIEHLTVSKEAILTANKIDVKAAQEAGVKAAMIDRLAINDKTFDGMIADIKRTITLEDPVGRVDKMWLNEAGLRIGSRRVPIGVIGIIYESRPNVTIDAATLCLKTGNATILKGGSDAINTNRVLVRVLKDALRDSGFPESTVGFVDTTDREATLTLIKQSDTLDCIIPRGGAGLIRFVTNNAKVPIIETGTGNCHIYIDEGYEIESATNIILNAKVQKPGACNAVETVLIHDQLLVSHVPTLGRALTAANVTIMADEDIHKILTAHKLPSELATQIDYETEYLDYKICLKSVKSLEEAIDHIEHYSTKHSEAILTHHYENAEKFLSQVDSAAVYVNASTRFTDGSMFGFGAEIGISTQKLHARGPMGLEALTTNKYVIYGQGQIR